MDWNQLKIILTDGVIRLLLTLLVLVIGWILAGWFAGRIRNSMKKHGRDQTLTLFVYNFLKTGLRVVVIIFALGTLGSDTAILTTLAGTVTLSVGLAMQGALANLAGGILIVTFRPFRIGDYITAGDLSGTVEDIGVLSTALRTPDNRKIILPNGKLANDNVINSTAYGLRRVDIPFLLPARTDVSEVRSILLRLIESDERLKDNPPPALHVAERTDYAVHLMFRVWADTNLYTDIYWGYLEAGKAALQKSGIELLEFTARP